MIAAVNAGKDVYVEKPLSMTLVEGVRLRDAVARSGRVLQVGSQQRSSTQFRRACELVRSGRVGRLQRIEIGLPIDPTKTDDPEQPVPANLDYDRWLGSTPLVSYTEQRVHPQADYGRPGWLRNESYCLGMITAWGSHHFDIAHWAMDVERRAQPHRRTGGVPGEQDLERARRLCGGAVYPGDVRVRASDQLPNGLKFIGDEGWIWVTREGQTTSSDPASPGRAMPPLDASDPKLLDPAGVNLELPQDEDHHLNWSPACVGPARLIVPPPEWRIADSTAGIVGWIAMKLADPTWDLKQGQVRRPA